MRDLYDDETIDMLTEAKQKKKKKMVMVKWGQVNIFEGTFNPEDEIQIAGGYYKNLVTQITNTKIVTKVQTRQFLIIYQNLLQQRGKSIIHLKLINIQSFDWTVNVLIMFLKGRGM